MIDLIDRKLLLNSRVYSTRSRKPNYEKMLKNLVNDILTAPAVDTERHAHWIRHQTDKHGRMLNDMVECSNCKIWFSNEYFVRKSFCPNCGCKMDEVEE